MRIMGRRGPSGGLILLLVLACRTISAAQGQPTTDPARATLSTAKSGKCTFPVSSTGTWMNGEAKVEMKPLTKPLELQFETIDLDGGTARAAGALVGAADAIDIIVQRSGKYLHFLQILRTGPLYATTIFEQENRPGRYKAVHTRHEYMDISIPGFTSKPEQYFGECTLAQ